MRVLDVVAALDAAGVEHVVVGGVAVVLHGHVRTTVDLDLVVDLSPENALAAIDVLTRLGLRPRLPVLAESFADEATRREWVERRHLVAFTLYDPDDPFVEVDLFADPPIPFADLLGESVVLEVRGVAVRIASVEHLVAMKELAGRTQDRADVEALRRLGDMPVDGESATVVGDDRPDHP
ncbi:MAG: nucleotidyl transferase AbiEii/AbiGii toxin family protein [Phycicoccus sp.]